MASRVRIAQASLIAPNHSESESSGRETLRIPMIAGDRSDWPISHRSPGCRAFA